ncbi:hypothetical protein C8J56DRAFT_892290 [Mycena floridula]|nr:hypothetical protein C8J56DRAFT_892290 [Mycena floridula]
MTKQVWYTQHLQIALLPVTVVAGLVAIILWWFIIRDPPLHPPPPLWTPRRSPESFDTGPGNGEGSVNQANSGGGNGFNNRGGPPDMRLENRCLVSNVWDPRVPRTSTVVQGWVDEMQIIPWLVQNVLLDMFHHPRSALTVKYQSAGSKSPPPLPVGLQETVRMKNLEGARGMTNAKSLCLDGSWFPQNLLADTFQRPSSL